ncbi:MAG: histidine kinase [Clostridia bacterium]
MTTRAQAFFRIVCYTTLAVSMTLIALSFMDPSARLQDNNPLCPVRIAGAYRVDGGTFVPIVRDAPLALADGNLVTVRGHFVRAIEPNEILLMRINNLRVQMRVNGALVFSFGETGTYPAFVNAPGNVWQSFRSPGITTTDEVTIVLENGYQGNLSERITCFLNRMQVGSERHLLTNMLREHLVSLITGLVTLSVGIVMLLISIAGIVFHIPNNRKSLLFAAILITGGTWLLSNFEYMSLMLPYPAMIGLIDAISLYALPIFAAMYVRIYVQSRIRMTLDIAAWMSTGFLLLAGILQFSGISDYNQLQTIGNSISLLAVLTCIACLEYEWRFKKNKPAHDTLLSLLPVCVGAVVDVVNYFLHLVPVNYGCQIGFLFFTVMQIALMVAQLQENAKHALQMENDLLQNRVTMMLSQIQPHFLYNSLTAIKQLCISDPERAEEAVGDFASYLRTNLDSLSKNAIIPFTRELRHAECYLKLEQMRFGDRVQVKYDLRYLGFSLPTLTVQPLVENAVRYGITRKQKGGTITIFSDETDTNYVVRVSDDGAGFDTSAALSTDRSHIGIENVRSRLKALCEGELILESEIGKGTTVTILIPKREADSV